MIYGMIIIYMWYDNFQYVYVWSYSICKSVLNSPNGLGMTEF